MSDGFQPFADNQGIPVIVEGKRDQRLLQTLKQEIEGEYTIMERGGDTKVLEALDVLASVPLPKFGVILDVDDRSQEEVYNQCYNKLEGNHDNISELANDGIAIGDTAVVHIGYSGLPDDEDISNLHIERHAVEDNILKLLLDDDETVRRISDSEISDSEELKSAIIDIERELEDHYGTLRRGKVHLEIARIILGYEGETGSFIQSLLSCTSIDFHTHASTEPLLATFRQLNDH